MILKKKKIAEAVEGTGRGLPSERQTEDQAFMCPAWLLSSHKQQDRG